MFNLRAKNGQTYFSSYILQIQKTFSKSHFAIVEAGADGEKTRKIVKEQGFIPLLLVNICATTSRK